MYGHDLRNVVQAKLACICLTAAVLLASPYLHAQESSPIPWVSGWDVGIWTAVATGEENTNSLTEAKIWTAGSYVGHRLVGEMGSGWRRGDLEYGFDVSPIFRTFGSQRIHGTAFDPVILRWNSGIRRGNLSPYIEVGGGGVVTAVNLPAGNTSTFNFIAKGGGGVHVLAHRNQTLDLGLGWWHVSNANLGTRNPEFNGIQFVIGYHWFR